MKYGTGGKRGALLLYYAHFMNHRDYKEFAPDCFYHIYNRGNGKMKVFLDPQDYGNFLKRLRLALGVSESQKGRPFLGEKGAPFSEPLQGPQIKPFSPNTFTLLAYCLMPNHFHFFIRQNTDIPISKLFLKICTSYSMYFNRRYKHVGHVFQDRFKAASVDSDSYFNRISVYIHANPKAAGLVEDLDDWSYSSYLDYVGKRKGNLCDTRLVLSGFKSGKAYADYVAEGFSISENVKILGLLIDEDEDE